MIINSDSVLSWLLLKILTFIRLHSGKETGEVHAGDRLLKTIASVKYSYSAALLVCRLTNYCTISTARSLL